MTMYFFPNPYANELMYSVLARFCVQSGNRSSIQNFDDLFGTRKIMASIELQGNLSALISNMPISSLYTEEDFIYKNTLFPYLAAFVPEERAREVIEIMKKGDLSKAYNKVGLTASDIKQNKYFRFCPECAKEDIEKYGETFWHRTFLITGVFVCPTHETYIYNSQVLMRGTNRQSYTSARVDDFKIDEVKQYCNDTFDKLLLIAKDVQAILNKQYTFQSIANHKYIYMAKLIKRDIANLNTMVHQKRLRKLMIDYWGEEVLKLLQLPIDINTGCPWLQKLVIDSSYMIQPLTHILLSRALDINIIELIDSNLDLEVTKSHKEVWEEKLIELSQTGLSLRKIAKVLDSTPQTIKKHYTRLGIEPFWKYNGGGRYTRIQYKDTEEFKYKLKESRKKWLNLINNNPNTSKSNLGKIEITLFTWLSRYDKTWLDDYTPNIKNDYEPVHWEQRDIELLPQVKEIIRGMLKEKPERISWSSVGGRLGIRGLLLKNKDRLPKIKVYMEEMEESDEDFQIRKIKKAIEELEDEGISVTKWNIVARSGINVKYIESTINNRAKGVLRKAGYDEDTL